MTRAHLDGPESDSHSDWVPATPTTFLISTTDQSVASRARNAADECAAVGKIGAIRLLLGVIRGTDLMSRHRYSKAAGSDASCRTRLSVGARRESWCGSYRQ